MTNRTAGVRTRGARTRPSRSRRPDPRLRFDPNALGLVEPPRSFYRRNTVLVARDLLGAWLGRRYRGSWYGGRIVETEAYLGSEDAAAHSWRGRRTLRVEPMYADGGHLYVFLVYGMHDCVNVVTRGEGIGQAVLLRAAAGPPAAPITRMAGPGKLAAALGITVADSGRDLVGGGPIRIFRRPRARRPRIAVSPRIGVNYSGVAAAWLLRFFDPDSPAVSGRVRDREAPTVSR
jgi:DNA-3-methyladenine glycosylase